MIALSTIPAWHVTFKIWFEIQILFLAAKYSIMHRTRERAREGDCDWTRPPQPTGCNCGLRGSLTFIFGYLVYFMQILIEIMFLLFRDLILHGKMNHCRVDWEPSRVEPSWVELAGWFDNIQFNCNSKSKIIAKLNLVGLTTNMSGLIIQKSVLLVQIWRQNTELSWPELWSVKDEGLCHFGVKNKRTLPRIQPAELSAKICQFSSW